MKILLDHCVPRSLRRLLPAHEVRTTVQCGWADVDNGALLAKAAQEFDVFLTVDQNIAYQQNVQTIPLSVVMFVTRDNRIASLQKLIAPLERALSEMNGRQFIRLPLLRHDRSRQPVLTAR